MKDAISDFPRRTRAGHEQSLAAQKNAMAIYSEVTMAKDALKEAGRGIACDGRRAGLKAPQGAFEGNLENGMASRIDRSGDRKILAHQSDTPMPECPRNGKHGRRVDGRSREDLFDGNGRRKREHHRQLDKGRRWDAADGPGKFAT